MNEQEQATLASNQLIELQSWLEDMTNDSDNECLSLNNIALIQQAYELVKGTN